MYDTRVCHTFCVKHGRHVWRNLRNKCALYALTNKEIATTKAPKRRARFQKQASTTFVY